MQRHPERLAVILLALALNSAVAQTAAEFPSGSTAASVEQLDAHLSGKTFITISSAGMRVQSKFGGGGGLFESGPGFTDSGRWKVEEGRLCLSLRLAGDSCGEARFDAGVLYVRRPTGEVVRYTPN